ncbi:BLUF domain-containing protein [Dokdonia sinensis]|uniref:BLUF domain-containing protein n=1 Tax=Dokdonia sinensis TaxID=2479847 RepID=A0A3M0G749_9FLAO|nr:BLUF domain-containing protein [Dokdonia sinensis]RMB56879.1 BLUF domain-containing protein [Dokdonia sinensis]
MYKYVSYVSHQAHNLSDDGIKRLLKHSRKNNEAVGITGLLIFFEGVFTQYVEGPADAVDTLYKKIEKDSRHNQVVKLASGKIDNRYYGDWSMAYEELTTNQYTDITGYKTLDKQHYFKSPLSNFEHPGIDLLESFLGSLRNYDI